MARPDKRNADYFPFYAKDGRTLFLLESKYQCKGTGFFTNVMRFLTLETDHHVNIQDETDKAYFFAKCHCDEESGMDMLDIMAKTGKINKELWDIRIVVSEDLLGSIQDAYRNRKNDIINIAEIREKYVSDINNSISDVGNSQESVVSDIDNTQSKEKKSILKNNNIVITPCPQKEIVNLFNEILPELPQPRVWDETRQENLRQRWKEDPQRQNIEWWTKFFNYIRACNFLMGLVEPDKNHKRFFLTLDWLIKKSNFIKVIEGKYENN